MTSKKFEKKLLIAAIFLFLILTIVSLFSGVASYSDTQVFWVLRFPRVLTAIAVGGGLGVAGVLVQSILSNPLADPYTTGISSAAALGSVIGGFIFSELRWSSVYFGQGIFSFVFALIGLVVMSAYLRDRFYSSIEMLLAGVIASFFFSSIATLLLALSDPIQWTSNFLRLMGSLGGLTFEAALFALACVLFLSFLGWLHWKSLDLIAVNEFTALSSGVDVAKVRKKIFIIVSILTAIMVSISGVIGFLGLIIPNLLRQLKVRDHFILLPLAFFVSAGFLLFADLCARFVARPAELPVGMVTALFGAPIFMALVRKSRL